MAKKFTVVTDLHRGTLHEKICTIPFENKNLILLGDIWDKKRALKKDSALMQAGIDCLISLKIPYVCSNHEGEQGLPEFYIDEETQSLWMHGHQCKKAYEKYKKDCETDWDGSNVVMHELTGLVNKLVHLIPFSENDAKRAVVLAKSKGCKIVCMGHHHLSYDKVIDGVRVVVFNKGVHEIEL